MSDVQNAAAETAAPKREAKNYEGMTKASAVADFKGSMEKNGLVLRVTKGELAAAAAALRDEKVVGALKTINEARGISGNRAQAASQSKAAAAAKSKGGAEIGG